MLWYEVKQRSEPSGKKRRRSEPSGSMKTTQQDIDGLLNLFGGN